MKKGDRVRIRQHGTVGYISEIDGTDMIVIDDDGFEYMVTTAQVDMLETPTATEMLLFRNSLTPTGKSKESSKKKASASREIIIDLHSDALLADRTGLSTTDLHKIQIEAIRQALLKESVHHGRKITFIHGKGDGTLRQELLSELKRCPAKTTHQDAPIEKYGFQGATIVTIL